MKKYKIYCLIPARGNSQRIKDKNLVLINNKPLIYYSIVDAIKTKLISKVFISSDSKKILDYSKSLKNRKIHTIKRLKKLSGPTATTDNVILNTLKILKNNNDIPDYLIILQATSPLRGSNDLKNSIQTVLENKYDSLFSSFRNENLFWKKIKNKIIPINYEPAKRPRSQDMNNEFIENGSIYIINVKKFTNTRLFGKIGMHIMKKKFSYQIDDHDDLNLFRNYLFKS